MLRVLCLILLLVSHATHADPLWQYSAGGKISGTPLVHGELVYVTGGNSLHVLSKVGELTWTYDIGAPSMSTVAIANNVIFVLADNGLHALDMTGNRLWLFESADGPLEVDGTTMGWGEGTHVDPWALYRSAPLVAGDSVFFGNRQGTWSVDMESGKLRWHTPTGTTHTRPVAYEGIIVIGSWDNHLYGLDAGDGSVIWKVASRLPGGKMAGWLGWEGFNLDPVIHRGVVYVGSRGTHVYAIDAKTGVENWSWKHPSSWVGSPAIVSDEVVYFGMSDGNSLIGLETKMGNQSLLFRNHFYNFARPQANGPNVYVASLSGELFQVLKSTGQGQKIFMTEASRENLAQLQSQDGGLEYLYSKEGGYTHENATKDLHRMLTMLDSLLSLTLDGETLYAGSANGNLYAIQIR